MALTAAAPGDLEGIQALLQRCELPYAELTTQHMTDFVVARHGSCIVACAGIERRRMDAVLLRSVAVDAAIRGDGLGSSIAAAAERVAGFSDLYLLTTTAALFFAKRGYAVVPRSSVPAEIAASTEFASLCPSTATCMVKRGR